MSADDKRSWPAYFDQLQAYLQWQTDQIIELQHKVSSLQTELAAVKEQKGIRIDRIEYSFDQLKVERLEGTLNIGVTPGGLQSVEEFAVNGTTSTIGAKPGPVGGTGGVACGGIPPQAQAVPQQMRDSAPNVVIKPSAAGGAAPAADAGEPDWLQQISDHIHGYLSEDMASDLRKWVEQYRLPLDEASQHLVIQDIRTQIDDRIRYYAKQEGNRAMTDRSFDSVAGDIVEKTKRDIRTAVEQYILGIVPKDGES